MTRLALAAGVALAVGIALASCTGFDAIQRNVCGNGLIEPGEDCDSNAASCVRCAVVCTRSSECPTTDYTCGTDGLCHAPGGALGSPVAAGSFLVDDFAITDVDHDGAGDVVGFARTSILVRHGDAGGLLARSDILFTPSQSGPPGLGDLDGDGALDVTLATPDGLVTYTSAFGELSPLDIQSTITSQAGAPLDIRSLFPVAGLTIGVFAVDHDQLFIGAVDLLAPDHPVIQPPCGARIGVVGPASLSLASVDVYQVNRETDLATDVVVAMTLGAGADGKLCVMAIHKDNLLAAAVLTDVTPPGAATPASRTLLADLDGNADRCPGLVNTDGGPAALRYWAGQLSGTHCALKAAASAAGDPLPPISEASPGAAVVGRIPVEPAVPFVVGDALVLGDGVYALIPGLASYQALYRTTRTLARVASADLDGDGAVDAVISAQGEAGLDVLLRSTSPPGFQLLRLDTASEATSLLLGDYDGNGIADIAYTEAVGSHQRLMISFGTADRPLAPVEVGEFPSIVGIARIEVPDSIDQLSLAADLAVLQSPSGGLATLTLLHGGPNRTMMPYFDPRSAAARAAGGVFRGIVIGRFGAPIGGEAAAAHRGLVAFSGALAAADPDPHFVHRAIELYRAYLARVTTGGRVGDAADNLAEMERELDKLKVAGKDIARSRRDARDVERTRLGVGVAISDQITDQATGDATAVREIGDAAGAPIRGLAATLDGKPLEPFALVDVTAGEHRLAVSAEGYFPAEKLTRAVAGQAQLVEVELRPRPARVAVTTEADARIAVDGRTIAAAPTPPLELTAGTHVVTIVRRGREPFGREIVVARGQAITLVAPLEHTARRRAVPYVLGGAGALALAALTAGALAVVHDSRAGELHDQIVLGNRPPSDGDRYDREVTTRDHDVTATWLLGGVALTAGVVGALALWFDVPLAGPAEGVRVTPALSAGRGGASVGVAARF